MIKQHVRMLIVISSIFLASCASPTGTNSLYHELNGKDGIAAIVDDFIRLIAKDELIFPYFAKASVSHFRQGFIDHVCDISGGPCQYKGDNMIDIHTGMHISEKDFNRVVELLILALEKNEVSYQTQNRLLKKMAPLRKQVIHI